MNNINLHTNFSNIIVFRNAISGLTTLQKRVAAIVVVAFCLLVAYSYMYINYWRERKVVIDDTPDPILLPPTTDESDPILMEPSSPLNSKGTKKEEPAPKKDEPAPKKGELVHETAQPLLNTEKVHGTEEPKGITEETEEKLIDADLEDQLSSFMESVQLFAPDVKRALTCTNNGINYKIWWNASTQAVNVQKEENFYHHASSKRQEEKLGINEANGKFSYFINNQPSLKGITQKQIEVLTGLLKEVKDLQTKLEEMKELENKFNPACLHLLLTFLKGPKGEQYRYHSSYASESPKKISLGGDPEIVLWMRINETAPQEQRRSRDEVDQPQATEKRYFINLQAKDGYYHRSTKDKIGIQNNDKGEIVSIYQDSQPSDASALFSANAIWNKRLTEGINQFLNQKALRLDHHNLSLHSLVLSQIPEVALALLCKNGTFEIPSNVNFLKDTLEPGDGIDAGGLTRQLLSDLPMYLLDGSKTRLLEINSSTGLPKLPLNKSQTYDNKKVQVFTNIGMLLSTCFKSNGQFVIGRMLPDQYFGLLKAVFNLGLAPSEDEIINASRHIMSDANAWMWDVWKTGRDLTDDELNTILNTLCLVDETDNPDDFEAPGVLKKTSVAKIVGAYLLNCYRAEVMAALAISQGIANDQKALMKNLSDDELSKRIQGEPFSRDDIANRVICFSTDPVVLQKMEWLKEFIQTQPKEWVLKLLSTVTGERAVTAQTRIHLTAVSGITNCHAHTCFKSLDVPTEHVSVGTDHGAVADDKQKFLNNLELTMSQDGFDFS